ncbi:uncharacterized protein LOC127722144 isoform X2 [Mytilus californianus]|nr:uncharacterized protein LOC127722144 isoform X2 [Mytilus californianus]XP_052084944.1 uncharacterized protein LOC127722144 isoform X2 [Mytilus californianus]XP_052084945.1 uncharacterized protein LOC127722144 isoform X2 [Mytilus californianus]
MAEIVTEISDIIDESADGMAEEAEGAEEDMEPEEQAEFEEEVADAKEAVQELSKTAEVFTNIMEGSLKMVKSFAIFVLKNIAVGAILYYVNVGLSKLTKVTKSKGQTGNKKILAIVKGIIKLIKTESNLCKAIKDWLQKHKDDTITLDGIEIKLESIFETKLKPISDAIEKTYATAKHLKTKKDGKSSFNIPTVANIDSLLDGLVSFHKSLRTLRDFAEQNKGKVVGLKSFLEIVTPEVLDEIQNQIENVKKMPTE